MAIIRKTYLPDPNFKPPIVAKASSAAEGLCKWIIALDMYDKVIKVVAPKKEKLEIANAEYEATMAILEEKRNEVRQLQARLDSLKERLEEAVLYKEKLLAEVALCESKLLKAEKLIGWRVNYFNMMICINIYYRYCESFEYFLILVSEILLTIRRCQLLKKKT